MENMNTRLDTRVWFRVTGRVNSIYSHGARHPSRVTGIKYKSHPERH